eukprot:1138709-Pelagomonas_calceolata.AAC.7
MALTWCHGIDFTGLLMTWSLAWALATKVASAGFSTMKQPLTSGSNQRNKHGFPTLPQTSQLRAAQIFLLA